MNAFASTITFVSIVTFAAGVVCMPAGAEPTQDQAVKDWNALEQSRTQLEQTLENVVPSYAPNIIGTDDEEMVAALKEFKANLQPQLEQQLEEFAATYGESPDAIDTRYKELVDFDWQGDTHPDTMPGRIYKEIAEWIANVAVACSNRSAQLVMEAERLKDTMDSYAAQATEANAAKLKRMLESAVGYNPDNEKAGEMVEQVDEDFASMQAAIEKKIDDARWPGHYKNFAGPGDPDDLAAAALKWLNADEESRNQDDPDHTFAVCVKGDWVSAKKNILGQTVQWGLPIYGACYDSEEKADGVCRVFGLTILTQEGGPDQKKEPPFTAVWVGDIFRMRIANVDGAAAGGGMIGGVGRGVRRVGLVLALLVAGLLAAAPLLKKVLPFLAPVYTALDPLTPVLGFIIVIVGLVGLLVNILTRFALLADLLPQLAAIVTGFVLGKQFILQLMKGTKAPPAEAAAPQASALGVPLGLACLALAVLHVLMGGIVFF